MANTSADVMNKAIDELGYSRWDDPQPGTKYGRWYANYTGNSYYGESGVPFCAMGASWVFDQVQAICSGLPGAYCPTMLAAAIHAGKIVDKKTAKYGDVVYFDWNHDGEADHVGLVEGNTGSYIQTVEFNTGNGQVLRRTRSFDTIIGVVRPNYSSAVPAPTTNNIDTLAHDVINGKYGNGDARKRALGDKYDAVQKRVNEILGAKPSAAPSNPVPAGTYRVVASSLNVRTAPSTASTSVASYSKGQTVNLDGWSQENGGYVWGRYIGASSGKYRYIAVRTSSGSNYLVKA